MVKNNHTPAGGNNTSGDGRLKEEGLTPTTSTSTPHRIFSVDDDPKEIQSDIRYLEGLHEGLKFALHANKSKRSVSSQSPMVHSSNNTLHHHEHQQHLPPTLELLSSKAHSVPDLNTVTSASPRRLHSPIRELSHDGIDGIDDNDDSRFIIHDSHGHDLLIDEINCQSPSHLESNDQASSTSSLESFTLRERQDAINETHPFGIRIWKPALYKKHRSVQRTAAQDIHETQLKTITWQVNCSNALWSILFGLPIAILFYSAAILVFLLGGGGLVTSSAKDYSKCFYKLANYFLWPFGKMVYLLQDEQYLQEDKDEGISMQQFYDWVTSYSNRLVFHQSQAKLQQREEQPVTESSSLMPPNTTTTPLNSNHPSYNSIRHQIPQPAAQRRYFGRGEWNWGRVLFYTIFHLAMEPILALLSLCLWLAVFTIPMSNVLWQIMYHCRRHPLALGFKNIENSSQSHENTIIQHQLNKNILLCTFRAAGWHYYKYTVDGTNVIVVNLISIVFFTIFDFYVLKNFLHWKTWITNESSIFILCLTSTIPLAFYIGQAVASISAQTSMGVGAVINAFFSTIVEIFLYCVALQQKKGLLVEGSMIGSILGAVLLLPGLSMCGGALNRKTQRYNPASAGVSSALLIFSMIVMFVPTVLYEIYGGYSVKCADPANDRDCTFSHPPLKFNHLFTRIIQPMSISCAIVLFCAYIIGLWFTLRTHAKMIWQVPITDPTSSAAEQQESNEQQEQGHHDAPNWSRTRSTCILLMSTLLYAIIAEILVSCVDSVLEDFPSLNPKFLGLTIFALVPNTTEFLNAISFAIHGNVALSMEIGSAYALQVCLLQIPALVIYSIFYTWSEKKSLINIRTQMFPLVFPRWDLFGAMTSVFMFTYLYAEGKSNYFKGSMLILLYFIIVVGFYFQGVISE
ncbi:calcium/hydrogen antiporter [Saccharomyces eubayanus]|uniref:calcium/hydrogen antiporter n=1 Tax=Saccharomyces eubayanus TaxID=1080349 RepID=UPI0006C1798A|nr:VNX1-like protein [Saccharomyces eubayanus]KOG96861.1 VNX1-like protein [Saccharomyces eubayanus]